MLKRVTKNTSLLIIAASIISMVPAIATDYQTIQVQEGTIYSASSKGGGVFVIDGEINGDEDRAIYLLKEGKYTKLDDAETGDKIGDICQGKYLEMTKNGSGVVYYVDITTGKESDEYSREVENSEIARKIRSKIKKDDDGKFLFGNYNNNLVTADTTVRGDGSGEETMWGISGKWRQYLYSLEKPFTTHDYSKDKDTIYSDEQGNYIDVDYNLGNICVYTTTGSSVSINNTDDTYNIKEDGKTYELKAQIKNLRTWDEGPEYIVRTAALTMWKKEKGIADATYENITNEVELGSKAKHYKQATNGDSVTVLQRISKVQASDSIDGIKYAKDVKTYFITDEDGNEQSLLGLGNGTDEIYTKMGVRVITGGTQGYNVSALYDFINKKIYAETLNYKSKNGYNYIGIDEYDEADSDAFALGCGDVWTLGDRYVKRFNCKENAFEKLYKVDGGMTNFSPSLPTDVVLWDEGEEAYSIVAPNILVEEKKDVEITTNTTTGTAVAIVGWIKDNNRNWSYIKTDGTKTTGWLNDGGTWYYLNSEGLMQTGWINDDGSWYYCNTSGVMLANTTIDGYVLGNSGAWINIKM